MTLRDATVAVTGASSGLGAAIAEEAARRGATVLLLARSETRLREVASRIAAAGGSATCYVVDLADAAAVERVCAQVIAACGGPPDVLVNNAGAGRWRPVHETPPAEVVESMAAPYFAAFWTTRALLPAMLRRGRGHIVTVTSLASPFVLPGTAAYTAARWALRGFHEALRLDLRGTGVGTTLFAAGQIATPYFERNDVDTARQTPWIAKIVPVLTPAAAATALLDGVERHRREVVTPRLMTAFLWMHRLSPQLVEWLIRTTLPKTH